MDQEAEMIELLNDWKYVWNYQLRLAYIFRLSCRILKEMSDSEGDDAPERVAKNCLKLLLDSTNSLVAKADETETEDAKAVIEQGTSLFKNNQSW